MMTDNSLRPATPDDAWLESLMREDAAATSYVEDGGFSASVLQRLPAARIRSSHRWIVPAMGVLGVLIGLVWLSGGESLVMNLASLAQMKSPSLQTIFVAVLPLGLLYWLALGAAWQQQ
jgi:hypothetical protein